MRRRAHILLHEEDLYQLLALEPGERVVGSFLAPLMNGIAIVIEGDETSSIPEVAPGAQSYRIKRPYALVNLRERLRGIVGESWSESGPDRDAYLRAVGEAVDREVFPHLDVSVPPRPVP